MKATLGEKGLAQTWQKKFPKTTPCCKCVGTARIAFVAHEGLVFRDREPYLYQIHKNAGRGKRWVHAQTSFAVYLCRECLEPTALYNQA